MEYGTRIHDIHRRERRVLHFMACLALLSFLSTCTAADTAAQRASRAAAAKGDILIGAGGPWSSAMGKTMWEGMELAIEEINARGGIGGRTLKVIKGDDQSSVDVGRMVAQSFVDNPDMVAVIGHLDSFVSLPNSIMYEYHGMLMLSPRSTAPRLTKQGFQRVFRTVSNDDLYGAVLARFAAGHNLKKIMIYQAKNEYGTGLANAFEKECEALEIEVPDRIAYDSGSDAATFRRDLQYWMANFSFDGIFAAGSIPQLPSFIAEARGLGIRVPIMAGEGLDTPEFVNLAGKAAEGTFIASEFMPEDPRTETRKFVSAFHRKFGRVPDTNAAKGYDTVHVLAAAIEEAGSTIPDRIAEALRKKVDWIGAAGSYRFDADGDLVGRNILIKVVRDGKLEKYPE